MDFASAPFQKLLFENADDDQLLSFLEQLDLEYSSAIDEKTRFGTLQILLPTLKAHVLRLESDQEACLETFVKPWMLSSFSQDSMVSTESVMALEGAVAFLIKRFFDGFGKACIMDMFLPQLLLAVKLEPDFVDLDPIAFIEKSVDVTALMEKVDKMMGSLDQVVMLDLECCISCLNRFVMELNNQDDGKVLTIDEAHQKEEEENEMYPIMELIFTIAVALIPCTDTTIRTKLTHDLLPNLLRWQQSSINHVSHEKQVKWCEMVWNRTLQMFALPATNLLRLEIYGLTVRFFDFYLGLPCKDEKPVPRKDLRFNESFFKILQSGLRSNDSLPRKYASYILKRIIDFSDKYNKSDDQEWTRYFNWTGKDCLDHWDDWFLLYDIAHENVIHLVEPVLPRFEVLLNENALDASWWIIIFYRGFQNDVPSVKKGLLEYIFSRENKQVLNTMGVEQTFMFNALLKTVDSTNLFQVPTQGTLVSPFGEQLRKFMRNIVDAFNDKEDKITFLKQLVHHMAHFISSHAPILYIMESLTEVEDTDAWGPDELKSLRLLVDRHRNFNVAVTKQFLRRLAITAVTKLSNTTTLSFSDIAKTISSLVNQYPITLQSDEYKIIHHWLEKSTSGMDIGSLSTGLTERIKTYICDLNSEDIPITVLQNQANVLARTSIFAIKDENTVKELYSVLLEKLSDETTSLNAFNKHLILLEALCENLEICFESNDMIQGIVNRQKLLERLDAIYLTEENIVDDNMLTIYLSLTKRLLVDSKEESHELIQYYYTKAIELLKKPNGSSVDPVREMGKLGYVRLLEIVYDAARNHQYFELDCDDELVSLVYNSQIKRTQEAQLVRPWGECLSYYISYKWNCVASIIRYTSVMIKSDKLGSKQVFDALTIYDEAVDQLDCASQVCGEAVIDVFGPLLAFPWEEKTAEVLSRCVDLAIDFMKENQNQSKTFPVLIKSFINVIFQPELLAVPELNAEGGPMKKAMKMVIETGDLKPFTTAQCTQLLHNYWSQYTQESMQSMIQYADEIASLLTFGPLRDREDQKLEAALGLKIASPAEREQADGTVETIFTQNDYIVRVLMNDLIMRLDINNQEHCLFANKMIDSLLAGINRDELYDYTHTFTVEHRLKIRTGCSLLLLIDFADDSKADGYLDILYKILKYETVTSSRCYIEWAVVRLLRKFPDRLGRLYDDLSNPEHRPNHIISLLTVTFTLGDSVPDDACAHHFTEIFVKLTPWLITNHYTIRLFSNCAWKRNWASCIERGYGDLILNNKLLTSISTFSDTYVDCVKFYEKVKLQYYMSKFDPIKDFNIEFIFRQLPTVFQVIDNEKIGSRAFMRVNPNAIDRCPFINPDREVYYTAADPTEELMVTQQQPSTGEDIFQKKILPWEMMLESDMDFTKHNIKENRPRNHLIVVASLIDRLPNLAGLCRTCEIFNAEQLIIPSLKIKEDPGFSTISVSSDRWMPMDEVVEADVISFLAKKKQEGYFLCGLEQTTTSSSLGDFEFPEKCVLLLGKERQGIPADMLQMLDATVEIPQYGITRSLNVHVSGAICIYEYTKQMQWKSTIQ